jgi:DNA helicase HerA-like ATPase
MNTRLTLPEPFEMPRPDQRVFILGSTGSGKTTMGVWLLSQAPFDQMPYVIVDYKLDDLIKGIKDKRKITFRDIPKEPGLYHLTPNPVSDDDAMEDWMLRIWRNRGIGLYIDEAMRLPMKKSGAFESILAQGRALYIPVITLSQRPVNLSRSVLSEANHVVVFRLTDIRDRETVAKYANVQVDYRLKKFHSVWYNVDAHQNYAVSPVPDRATILGTFKERLRGLGHRREAI